MGASYELPSVDVATAGTVGPPGKRVFYLQFRQDDAVVSLRLEKQQVAALADHLAGMLDDLPQPETVPHPDALALVEPVEAAWVVGSIGLAFDADLDRIVFLAEEVVTVDEEGEPDAAALEQRGRLTARFTRAQAAALVERGRALVAAGRPPCPLCGRPLDPDGHICPRSNGHGVH